MSRFQYSYTAIFSPNMTAVNVAHSQDFSTLGKGAAYPMWGSSNISVFGNQGKDSQTGVASTLMPNLL